jgi:RNA polymerase sigma-70 factor (ECF subfamily)
LFNDDGSVVTAVKAGDTEAFRVLVDRHKARLFAVLMTLTGDRDVAEDLAQESFVRAFTGLGNYRADACFGTWLIQIAIHAARDHRRRAQRERRRSPLSLDELPESQRESAEVAVARDGDDPSAHVQASEEANMLQGALIRLPPEYREVLLLKHFEGWSYEAIGRLSEESVGTVKVRAHRARRMLRDILRQMDPSLEEPKAGARGRHLTGMTRTRDG